MGIYIKGIDKPECCSDCNFNYDWQECLAKNGREYDSWDFTNHSAEWVYASCPLIDIDIVWCCECRNFIDEKSVFADGLCRLHLNRHKNKNDFCSQGIRREK